VEVEWYEVEGIVASLSSGQEITRDREQNNVRGMVANQNLPRRQRPASRHHQDRPPPAS
jgi:hypothetical protein